MTQEDELEIEITGRLAEQRLRNRAIDILEILAEGQEGAERIGAEEWFNRFFDVFDDDTPLGPWQSWSTFTPEEVNALGGVHFLMVMAAETTSPIVSVEELAELRWPARVQPLARDVFRLLAERGRFSEEREEDEPSGS
jgi:hypothetical protein